VLGNDRDRGALAVGDRRCFREAQNLMFAEIQSDPD